MIELKPATFTVKQRSPRNRTVDSTLDNKRFIVWDGEGVNLAGNGRPQSYVLFGSSEGHISSRYGLSTFDCLDHMLETGDRNPGAIHAGFAFTYDANMICQSMSPNTLGRLHRQGHVRLKRRNGDVYSVTFRKGKFFRVTRYRENYHRKTNPHAKTTVQIFDIFSFFMTSFVKAYEEYIGPVPNIIIQGKKGRSSFTIAEFDTIEKYWSIEVQLLKQLAEELRKRVYNAGLRINQWHGPGALADFALKKYGVKAHMADTSPEIREAARYAYAGGRFELFKVGRVTGRIFGIDINSAYPYAISQLPSLVDGTWEHVISPKRIAKFGVYHVRLKKFGGFAHAPSPLFHRDTDGNISFPWHTEGWYWGPEARIAVQYGAELIEGWQYTGSKQRPFSWIPEMYATRKDWVARAISAQIALKLCMNSCYGKLAQRIGWDPAKGRIPTWHQLEWAGWVTSYVRAMLYEVIMKIPFDQLIAVETDGIYTTVHPDKLDITHSKELGGWDVTEYDEILYVQSGLAWLHNNDRNSKHYGWKPKRRGLDGCIAGHTPDECDCPGTFSLGACKEFLGGLQPDSSWKPYVGQTTRFLGMGQALMSSVPTQMRHCVWETTTRDIGPGTTGKRIHLPTMCHACEAGATAYDMPHDLTIRSLSTLHPWSAPHDIPWEGGTSYTRWRDYAESEDDNVTLQYV